MSNDAKEKEILEAAQLVGRTLDKKKATKVQVFYIGEKSSFADYLIIGSANNDRHLVSLVEAVNEALFPLGREENIIEGKKDSGWMLVDYGNIVVNVLTEKMRERYRLEELWVDCPEINLETDLINHQNQ